MRRRPCRRTYIFRVLIETRLDELLELFGVIACELGRVVLGNKEENPHRVQLAIRWLALRQLNRRDAQRPNVGL